MKRIYSILPVLVLCVGLLLAAHTVEAAGDVSINSTNFPDAYFRNYVSANLDTDGDGKLSPAEIADVTYINVSNQNISYLNGVEHFTALKTLSCNGNQISYMDLSANTALSFLNCSSNQLAELRLGSNKALHYLNCSGNPLEILYIADHSSLGTLYAQNCTALTELDCSGCGMSALYIDGCTALESLKCDKNDLVILDTTGFPALEYLNCGDNGITDLHLSKNTELVSLFCANNSMNKLDLSNNTELRILYCYGNKLTTLNVSSCPKLVDVYKNGTRKEYTDSSTGQAYYEYKLNYNYLGVDAATSVLNKPAITSQPIDRSVPEGNVAYFSVQADDADSYQWYYRKSSTGSWTEVSAASGKTATYSLTTATRHNGYQYRCKVSNQVGYVYSEIVTLTVRPTIKTTEVTITAPTAGAKPSYKAVLPSGAKYSCESGSSSDYFKNGVMWRDLTAEQDISATTAFVTGHSYRVRIYLMPNSGCEFSGDVTATVNGKSAVTWLNYDETLDVDILRVEYTFPELAAKPTITTQPTAQTVVEGKTASFTVGAEGEGLTYQWYYRTSSTGSWTMVSAASGKTAIYKLTTAARHNGYQYRCKVMNSAGYVYTGTRKLTVITKPTITTQPKSVSVAEGKTATFKVVASGEALSYQWYYRKSSGGSWTEVSAASGKTATYSLTTAARHNGYQYRCKVKNVAGEVYTNIVKLTVK